MVERVRLRRSEVSVSIFITMDYGIACIRCAADGVYTSTSGFFRRHNQTTNQSSIFSLCEKHSDEVNKSVPDAVVEPFHDAAHSNLGLALWEGAEATARKGFSFSQSMTTSGPSYELYCGMCAQTPSLINITDGKKRQNVHYVLQHVPATFMTWTEHDVPMPLCAFHAGCMHPEVWCTLTTESTDKRQIPAKQTTVTKGGKITQTEVRTPTAHIAMTVHQWMEGMHYLEQSAPSGKSFSPFAVEEKLVQPPDKEILDALVQDPLLAEPISKARAYLKTIRCGLWNPKCNQSGKSLSIETEIWSASGLEDKFSVGLRKENASWVPKPSAHWEPPNEETFMQIMELQKDINGEPSEIKFKHDGRVYFRVNYAVLRDLLEPDIHAVSSTIVQSAREASKTIDWGTAIQDALVAANFESFKRAMDKFEELPNEVIRRLVDVWIANQIHDA